MASGTEFLVDIQNRIQGDPTSQLDATERSLKAAQDRYKELERNALSASKALEKSGAALAGLEGKAAKAMEAGDADAFWKLAPAIDAARAKQAELTAEANTAKAALSGQATAVSKLADEFVALKKAEDAATKAEQDLKNLKQEHEKADKALADEQRRGLEQIAKTGDGLTKLPGPLGAVGGRAKELTEGWRDLSEQLGQGRAAMLVGAAAVAALVAALVAGAFAVGKWVIGLANARRNQVLTMEAMFQSAEAAKAVQGSFGGITRETGIAGDRLAELAKELHGANVAADEIPAALKAIAQQESALGDSSGTSDLIAKLKSGQKSVAQLGDEMQKQFGDVARRKALGLDQQMEVLKANLADLFGGANIEGFLKGVQRLIGLLDGTSASGKAIKAIFDSFLGPLGGTERIFIAIERFILGALISAMKLAIGIKSIAKALGFDVGGLGEIVDAADLGKVALFTLLIPFAPIMVAIAAVVATVYALINTWNTLSGIATSVASAVTGAWESISSFLSGLDLGQVGADLITGLADGIKNNAQKVIQAITGAVGDAIAQAKSLLKIASPSKVFEEIGAFTAEGFAGGVDAGAPEVQRSMADMIEPPSPSDAPASVTNESGNRGSITINIYGVEKAEDVTGKIEEALSRFFERGATQLGAPV